MGAAELVDLHVHVLPGIDDGPQDLAATIGLLRVAHRQGTRTLVATPHMYSPSFGALSVEQVEEVFRRTVDSLRNLASEPGNAFLHDLTLHLGAENYLSSEFLEAVERRQVLALGPSQTLLLEFPIYLPVAAMLTAIDRVLDAGYTPMVAHVERYSTVLESEENVDRLHDRGALLQINASSFHRGALGSLKGPSAFMLKTLRADVIASDGHDAESRPPDLGTALTLLSKKLSEENALTWLVENPFAVLQGRALTC